MQQKQTFTGHRSNRKIPLCKVTLIVILDLFTTGLLGIHNHSYKSLTTLVSHINYQEIIYKSLYIKGTTVYLDLLRH